MISRKFKSQQNQKFIVLDNEVVETNGLKSDGIKTILDTRVNIDDLKRHQYLLNRTRGLAKPRMK